MLFRSVAGPHISTDGRDLLLGGLAAHRARVIALRERSDVDPPAPAGFEVPAITTDAEARQLLADVEGRLAASYADLAADTPGGDRTDAVLAARECSVRSVSWGGAPQAFPGR